MEDFRKELERLINKNSKENTSETPDFILAQYLCNCLDSFDCAVQQRESWYGRGLRLVETDTKINKNIG